MVGPEIDFPEETVASRSRAHTIVHSSPGQAIDWRRSLGAGPIPRIASHRIVVEQVDDSAGNESIGTESRHRALMFYPIIIPACGGAERMCRIRHRLSDLRVGDVAAGFRSKQGILPAADLTRR